MHPLFLMCVLLAHAEKQNTKVPECLSKYDPSEVEPKRRDKEHF